MNFKLFDVQRLLPKLFNKSMFRMYTKDFHLDIKVNDFMKERIINSTQDLFSRYYGFRFKKVGKGVWEAELNKEVMKGARCII